MPTDVEEKSILITETKDIEVPNLVWTAEEVLYWTGFQQRLERARVARDKMHDEFDGMTYIKRCEENRKLANTFIAPRLNKEDTQYASGLVRQKLYALLSALNGLDLSPDINAFDNDNIELSELGQSMEDIIWKTEEIDLDEEKKLMRQYTLLEQGEVFVEDIWIEKFKLAKNLTAKFNGKINSAKWTSRLKKEGEMATRNIIQNENVYLGDITTFGIEKQPYIFTVETKPYDLAKQIYGKWERWDFVSRQKKTTIQGKTQETTIYNSNWLFGELQKGFVEVVKYQDKPNNEYQIVVNGIPMLPVGFPLPWKHGEYSVAMQIYSLINHFFAYGKSLPMILRPQIAVYDEMNKLMILKTQYSQKPSLANLSGRVLSSRVFMPGFIASGIDPSQVKIMFPDIAKGFTVAEARALEIIQRTIDSNSVNPTFAGQQPAGNPTATQIIEVQRQAKMVLGLTIFVCSMLEKKLADIRLANVLENWFEPIEESLDKARNVLVDKFRQFTRKVPIEGEGIGQRIVRVISGEQMPKTSFEVMREEEEIKEKTGIATRIVNLNHEQMKMRKFIWYTTIIPKERRSSPANKLLFREMVSDLLSVFPPQEINMETLKEEFAINWERNFERLFKPAESMPQLPLMAGQETVGQETGVPLKQTKPNQVIPNERDRARLTLNIPGA
ncbi:MAG: hypothetical protein AABY15_08720 [Nanoarchaeota archaeon]